jgi:type III restriction enzyme
MATGSGKTVVMGALIAYHYFNRREYRNDVRFADNFLAVAPGITIRDRLSVLRVDTRLGVDAEDYYHVRFLVPESWRKEMPELNKRIVITNYHAFEPKTLQGNNRSPFDGKIQADGTKQQATEDYSQTIGRLLGNFRPGSRLLIINDEAHHCYLPREDERKAEGEDADEEIPARIRPHHRRPLQALQGRHDRSAAAPADDAYFRDAGADQAIRNHFSHRRRLPSRIRRRTADRQFLQYRRLRN